MISVIIPAHNEESVIGRCLAVLTGAGGPQMKITVVCNGCHDRTARVAGGFGPQVRVIETPTPSKTNALNVGDAAAGDVFPRFYIDADIVIRPDYLARLAEELESGRFLAAAPRFRMNLAGASWPVRAFYDINDRMPSSREGIGGSGIYGLSREGRARFDRFPDITADDAFVRLHFAPEERVTLADCFSEVQAPRTLGELVAIKTRSHFGNAQIKGLYPALWRRNRGPGNLPALRRLTLRPWLWVKLAVYVYVKGVARVRARRMLRHGESQRWERAESSRRGGSSHRAELADSLCGHPMPARGGASGTAGTSVDSAPPLAI